MLELLFDGSGDAAGSKIEGCDVGGINEEALRVRS